MFELFSNLEYQKARCENKDHPEYEENKDLQKHLYTKLHGYESAMLDMHHMLEDSGLLKKNDYKAI
tara:strand:+ start:272 stop:469 length:198 start_codon:yes stop_codon:yes gene_type:complete